MTCWRLVFDLDFGGAKTRLWLVWFFVIIGFDRYLLDVLGLFVSTCSDVRASPNTPATPLVY
jgi:hypothetical protein